MASSFGTDNVIMALGQSNRVCQVDLWDLADRQLEEVLAAMQVPFPELEELRCSLTLMMKRYQSFTFPIRSWVDLPRVWNTSR